MKSPNSKNFSGIFGFATRKKKKKKKFFLALFITHSWPLVPEKTTRGGAQTKRTSSRQPNNIHKPSREKKSTDQTNNKAQQAKQKNFFFCCWSPRRKKIFSFCWPGPLLDRTKKNFFALSLHPSTNKTKQKNFFVCFLALAIEKKISTRTYSFPRIDQTITIYHST